MDIPVQTIQNTFKQTQQSTFWTSFFQSSCSFASCPCRFWGKGQTKGETDFPIWKKKMGLGSHILEQDNFDLIWQHNFSQFWVRNLTSWWFQPTSKIYIVKLDDFPKFRVEKKNIWVATYEYHSRPDWITLSSLKRSKPPMVKVIG